MLLLDHVRIPHFNVRVSAQPWGYRSDTDSAPSSRCSPDSVAWIRLLANTASRQTTSSHMLDLFLVLGCEHLPANHLLFSAGNDGVHPCWYRARRGHGSRSLGYRSSALLRRSSAVPRPIRDLRARNAGYVVTLDVLILNRSIYCL
jgi:hypothetical protein